MCVQYEAYGRKIMSKSSNYSHIKTKNMNNIILKRLKEKQNVYESETKLYNDIKVLKKRDDIGSKEIEVKK